MLYVSSKTNRCETISGHRQILVANNILVVNCQITSLREWEGVSHAPHLGGVFFKNPINTMVSEKKKC